jgi:hypothetical protein
MNPLELTVCDVTGEKKSTREKRGEERKRKREERVGKREDRGDNWKGLVKTEREGE